MLGVATQSTGMEKRTSETVPGTSPELPLPLSVIRTSVDNSTFPMWSLPSLLRRTSVAEAAINTSASSAGVDGSPAITSKRAEPPPAPFAEVVSKGDSSTGGVHDWYASGRTCVLFGFVQALNAGIRGTRNGVAPPGRG